MTPSGPGRGRPAPLCAVWCLNGQEGMPLAGPPRPRHRRAATGAQSCASPHPRRTLTMAAPIALAVSVNAPADRITDALSASEGLASFWATDSDAEPRTGHWAGTTVTWDLAQSGD